MLKITNKITNPMTVIAIFAIISETSAAVSLPFLDNKDREIYVWFLISFPFYLLFLFFITLNFNHRSLYSPSDFGKDKNFLKAAEHSERDSERKVPLRKTDGSCAFEITSCVVSSNTGSGGFQRPCRIHNAPDPPIDIDGQANPVVQTIKLSPLISELNIIDARDVDASKEFDAILDTLRSAGKKNPRVLVFLSNHVSDSLAHTSLQQIKQAKKSSGATLCVVYNLCTQTVTLLGRTS
ncbi:hypothetical protein LOY49_20635 [Pseudomonas atacamensis]|uniref:hypothetical protein n=1 Tax=Pseudomonas atacamensis TaxID=2565368 RepID=UPI002160932F|nr:hypothetical protein [Pseudomonas atacamensis]UVK92613.1 hypothetical protein LOY49_20635 [Pseudomonas atacamensis]UVL13133.1 hypothetical protein LOY27_20910 [Pseudomonas atacamensis]